MLNVIKAPHMNLETAVKNHHYWAPLLYGLLSLISLVLHVRFHIFLKASFKGIKCKEHYEFSGFAGFSFFIINCADGGMARKVFFSSDSN